MDIRIYVIAITFAVFVTGCWLVGSNPSPEKPSTDIYQINDPQSAVENCNNLGAVEGDLGWMWWGIKKWSAQDEVIGRTVEMGGNAFHITGINDGGIVAVVYRCPPELLPAIGEIP